MELVKQKEYIVYLTEFKEDKLLNFYKGTYRGDHYNKHIFVDVIEIKSQKDTFRAGYYVSMKRKDLTLFPTSVYTFQDVEKVKENGKKAIQSMEKRSLDMVLKRLVNETFEWL